MSRRKSKKMSNNKPSEPMLSVPLVGVLDNINKKQDDILKELRNKADKSELSIMQGAVQGVIDGFRSDVANMRENFREELGSVKDKVSKLESVQSLAGAVKTNTENMEKQQKKTKDQERQTRLQWVGLVLVVLGQLLSLWLHR